MHPLRGYLRRKSGRSREAHGDDPSRVLLIEEELRLADVVTDGLVVDGYEVVVAEDGEVGLFLATTEPFDLIVLDLRVAADSEVELVERITEGSDGAPVIVLSERDDPTARRECEAAGAAAIIAKPVVVESLRVTVKEQLGRRRAQ